MSTLQVNTIRSATANTPPVVQDSNLLEIGTFCRAWVNFNGTGTVAIRNSFNITSITDNGTGNYGVTITNNLPNATYSVTLGCNNSVLGTGEWAYSIRDLQVGSFGVNFGDNNNDTAFDAELVCASVIC